MYPNKVDERKRTGVRVVRAATMVGAVALGVASALCPPAAAALLPGWVTLLVVERVASRAAFRAGKELVITWPAASSPPPEDLAAPGQVTSPPPAEDLGVPGQVTSSPPAEDLGVPGQVTSSPPAEDLGVPGQVTSSPPVEDLGVPGQVTSPPPGLVEDLDVSKPTPARNVRGQFVARQVAAAVGPDEAPVPAEDLEEGKP